MGRFAFASPTSENAAKSPRSTRAVARYVTDMPRVKKPVNSVVNRKVVKKRPVKKKAAAKKRPAKKKAAAKKRPARKKKAIPLTKGADLPRVQGVGLATLAGEIVEPVTPLALGNKKPVNSRTQLVTMQRMHANRKINQLAMRERVAGNVRLTHIVRLLRELQTIDEEVQGAKNFVTDDEAKGYAIRVRTLEVRLTKMLQLFNKYCPDLGAIKLDGDSNEDNLKAAAAAFADAVTR